MLRRRHEEVVPPERPRDQAVAHAAAVAGLAGVWVYQGLVPKLLAVDTDEVALWRSSLGLGEGAARRAVRVSGALEIAAGAITIRHARQRWPFVATAVAMPLLAGSALVADRRAFTRAFNPASLNWAVAALAVVAAVTTDADRSGAVRRSV